MKSKSNKGNMVFVFKILAESVPLLIIPYCILVILSAVLDAFSYRFLGLSLDSFQLSIVDKNQIFIQNILLFVLFRYILPHIFNLIIDILYNILNLKIQKHLSEKILLKTVKLPLNIIEDYNYQNILSQVSGMDSKYIFSYVSNYIGMIYMVVKGISLFGILFEFGSIMPFLLITIFIIDIFVKSFNTNISLKFKIDTTQEKRKIDYYMQLFLNSKTLKGMKINGAVGYFKNLFENTSLKYYDKETKINKKIEYIYMLVGLAREIILSLTFLLSIILVYEGKVTVGGFVAFYTSVGIVSEYYELFSMHFKYAREKKYYIKLLNKFLNCMELDRWGNKVINEITSISFSKVNFSYGDNKILKDISFKVNKGEKIAIIGENGSGKSTLIRLLSGLDKPNQGMIYINGEEQKNIDIHSYRDRVSLVLQDFGKYHFEIKENIGISDFVKINDEKLLIKTSQDVGIYDFINNTRKGFSQQLGSEYTDGIDLSGGEWQKMSISRAYFKERDILLVDEPTSALDALSESFIGKQFMEISKDSILFIVSHRLGLTTLADKILFLKKGELIEFGSYEELMEKDGEYAQMFRLQLSLYKTENP